MHGEGGESGEGAAGAGKERWLLTYSDMITLLMVFFIILYSFSKTDAAKYQAIAVSLHAALSGGNRTAGLPQATANALVRLTPQPTPTAQTQPTEANSLLSSIAAQLQRVLSASPATAAQASVALRPHSVDLAFNGNTVYFRSASAALTPAFEQLLGRIAPILKETPDQIEVEGFTNDLPLRSARYPTAWELSSARADNVVRYLAEDEGLPPHQLVAVGLGQWHPLYPNTSPQNLARNRSVHIVVTDVPPLGLDQGGPDVAPPGQAVR
jgi:chemotaxis protein MotB